ncbi:hypothetical protein AGLY_015971, partial [Aphis glycines]
MFKKNLPHCLVHVVLNFSIKALMSQSLLFSNFALQLFSEAQTITLSQDAHQYFEPSKHLVLLNWLTPKLLFLLHSPVSSHIIHVGNSTKSISSILIESLVKRSSNTVINASQAAQLSVLSNSTDSVVVKCTFFFGSPLTSVSLLEISDSKADIKMTHIGQLLELSLSLFEVKDRSASPYWSTNCLHCCSNDDGTTKQDFSNAERISASDFGSEVVHQPQQVSLSMRALLHRPDTVQTTFGSICEAKVSTSSVLTGGQQCDEADKGQRPTKARTTRESGHLKGFFSATTVEGYSNSVLNNIQYNVLRTRIIKIRLADDNKTRKRFCSQWTRYDESKTDDTTASVAKMRRR